MKVYLASYRGHKPGLACLVDKGIRYFDKAQYSHCEITLGDPFVARVRCYSSSGMDGGVRYKVMQLKQANWDLLSLPWVSEAAVLAQFNETKGLPYDYLGTGRFALPWLLREHKTRWFCSEWCGQVMGLSEPWRLSPAALRMVALVMGANEVWHEDNQA